MTQKNGTGPVMFEVARWHGYVLAAIFLIYGGVKIILGILDRSYGDFGTCVAFIVIGLVVVSFALAYHQQRRWGWYGLIVINALVVIGAIAGYSHVENVVLMLVSAIVLYFLLSSETRSYLLKGR
jgi:hypothetical protein